MLYRWRVGKVKITASDEQWIHGILQQENKGEVTWSSPLFCRGKVGLGRERNKLFLVRLETLEIAPRVWWAQEAIINTITARKVIYTCAAYGSLELFVDLIKTNVTKVACIVVKIEKISKFVSSLEDKKKQNFLNYGGKCRTILNKQLHITMHHSPIVCLLFSFF